MTDASPDRHDKFRAYRERKKAAGYKLTRRWSWDVHSPEFQEQLRRENEILKNAPEEQEALDFIEAAMIEMLDDWD